MKIIITEEQYNLISEQNSPFYYQSSPNSDYVLSSGGPKNKPKGSIDASYLFPNGKYPNTLKVNQVNDIISKKRINPKSNVNNLQFKPKFDSLVSILDNARNISWDEGIKKTLFQDEDDIKKLAVTLLAWIQKNKGYNPELLKSAITQIFRESKGSPITFISPKELWGFATNTLGFDPLNWKEDFRANHSQGYAQIQPDTAKKYGIEMNQVYTLGGSLDALYKMLSTNYSKANNLYKGNTVTIYQNQNLKQVPAIGGNAALHMAIAAHNAGDGIIDRWCETNIPGIANKCSETKRQPYKDKNLVAVTKKERPIENYFPNIGGVHNYIPQFRKAFDAMTNLPKTLSLSQPPVNIKQTKS